MLAFVDPEDPHWTVTAFFIFNRAGIIISFTLIYLAHPTLFPTLFAATSLGMVNFSARLLVILAPEFAEIAYPVPELIIVTIQILMGLAVLYLIEKKDDELIKWPIESSAEIEAEKSKAE
mmetsp:Transcript_27305/g.36541  ORF Transcript_27305/g.36541 Transcript_27305/m.36541 type:complete len:120 (+) Transcript_27305:1289-1648(+)